MLWLVDVIGGGLLSVLLARTSAWKDKSDNVRRMRLTVGSLASGFLFGLACYLVAWWIVSFTVDNATKAWLLSLNNAMKAWFLFAGLPVLSIALTFLLESLNKRIK